MLKIFVSPCLSTYLLQVISLRKENVHSFTRTDSVIPGYPCGAYHNLKTGFCTTRSGFIVVTAPFLPRVVRLHFL